PARVVIEDVRGGRNIAAQGFQVSLAVVQRFQQSKLFFVLLDEFSDAPDNPLALRNVHLAPEAFLKRAPRRLHCAVHILRAGVGDGCELLSCGRVQDRDGPPRHGRFPFTVDEKSERLQSLFDQRSIHRISPCPSSLTLTELSPANAQEGFRISRGPVSLRHAKSTGRTPLIPSLALV